MLLTDAAPEAESPGTWWLLETLSSNKDVVFCWLPPPHTYTDTCTPPTYTHVLTYTSAPTKTDGEKLWVFCCCSQPPSTCPTALTLPALLEYFHAFLPGAPQETSRITGWKLIIIHYLFSYLPMSFSLVLAELEFIPYFNLVLCRGRNLMRRWDIFLITAFSESTKRTTQFLNRGSKAENVYSTLGLPIHVCWEDLESCLINLSVKGSGLPWAWNESSPLKTLKTVIAPATCPCGGSPLRGQMSTISNKNPTCYFINRSLAGLWPPCTSLPTEVRDQMITENGSVLGLNLQLMF